MYHGTKRILKTRTDRLKDHAKTFKHRDAIKEVIQKPQKVSMFLSLFDKAFTDIRNLFKLVLFMCEENLPILKY